MKEEVHLLESTLREDGKRPKRLRQSEWKRMTPVRLIEEGVMPEAVRAARSLKSFTPSRASASSEWETAQREGEVTVSLAHIQIRQLAGSGPAISIISRPAWRRYLAHAKVNGIDFADYRMFAKARTRDKKSWGRWVFALGLPLWVHGPFRTEVQIGPMHCSVDAYITSDDRFGDKFLLGQDVWSTVSLKTMVPRAFDLEQNKARSGAPLAMTTSAHLMLRNGASGALNCNKMFRTLLDTGAGPNVMAQKTFEELGGSMEKLRPSQYMLTMADSTSMKTLGHAPDISLAIADIVIKTDFVIVDALGSDDIILGRNFMMQYDVLLDIPRGRVEIRNLQGAYRICKVLENAPPEQQSMARIAARVEIPGESIECVKVKVVVSPSEFRKGDRPRAGCWLAEVDGESGTFLKRKGIALPKAIITVRDGEAMIPMCNIQPGEESTVFLPKDSARIRLRPVIERYHRVGEQQNPQEECKMVMELGEGGRVVSAEMKVEETMSSRSTYATSEIPIKVAGEKLREFQRRPDTEHLKERLEPEVYQELDVLLEDFKELFMRDKTDIGHARGFQHHIEVEPGIEPPRDTYRRFPLPKREAADEQVQALLDDGLIEPSCSPFASAIVLVKKSDGSWRMCIDFRRLNAITKKDAFPLPRIDEALEKLGNAQFFSTLDMGSAFLAGTPDGAGQGVHSVCHPQGQFQWNRMPFGLCNATATFQRLMSQVLAKVIPKYGNVVLCYVDDVLVATRNQLDHVRRLREVFSALYAAGLKLKAAKCELFQTHIKYLGRTNRRRRSEAGP